MPSKSSARSISTVPNARRRELLALLADGEFKSGEYLAAKLKVTRSAVWKLIGKMRALGIAIEAISRQGYRLPHAVELYDRGSIEQALSATGRSNVHRIDTLLTVDSTNRHLLDAPDAPVGTADACLAELQTAGRGRRGRSWLAPFGSGICLSLSWQFAEAPPTFSALSLAVGVAVLRALRRFGGEPVQLKWPNDLTWNQRKLGGILIDMRGEAGGPARVVIGIGLNLRLPPSVRLELAEQQAALVTDVHEILKARTPNRNVLVASLIDELLTAIKQFEREGFAAFKSEWQAHDSLFNAPVKILTATQTINGIARGVANDGSLAVEIEGKLRQFMSGDVSLRPLQ